MGMLATYHHYSTPIYEYMAMDEDGALCNNGSRVNLPMSELLDITISDTMMEVIYKMSENSEYRYVNIIMIPPGHLIPKGFCFLKSIEYLSMTYCIFTRIEKTEEEEKIDFREERIEKLLNKNKEDEND
ncbi:MAG: hypothetical protein SLAVMIC_01041 [uncultured marine phage]|uniref:Uncharacterized protein n=1 Tax=uncultured marine phage TaxID=707152 RepID=A0A8D9CB29_9VIRU|nr:MAG: hypothetical protein SLAVMIC_01041 [uncultured marine phage]